MPKPDAQRISEAIVAWTGYGESSWPRRDPARLASKVGTDAAVELLPFVQDLATEFYASDACRTARTIVEMGAEASARFRALHPEISGGAVEALAWCYTFDNR